MDEIKVSYLLSLKNGSKIHIKPENKGKFSRSAKAAGRSVQEHARHVVNDPNATTLQKRRAQFALNAKKFKHQQGGLVYNPYIQSSIPSVLERESNPKIEVPNYLDSVSADETPFPVEPVKVDYPISEFSFYTPEEKPDNYVERSEFWGKGKVYKTSEKEQFKSDLFGAYTKALIGRGLDEDSATEFAKRLVAQDALESRYGQSRLSASYNFGGIKDFRENSDSLKVSTREHENGKYVTKTQPFRKFKNIDEYVNYKIDLLGNSNYNVFAYTPNALYKRLTSAKKKYATDPDYERKLNNIYNTLWGR